MVRQYYQTKNDATFMTTNRLAPYAAYADAYTLRGLRGLRGLTVDARGYLMAIRSRIIAEELSQC